MRRAIRSRSTLSSLAPFINPRLARLQLALFVCVHSDGYVKRLASRLSMAAVLEGAQRDRSRPNLSHPASYCCRRTTNAHSEEKLNVKGTTKDKNHQAR